MHWQDPVLSVAFVALDIAMIPTILGPHKPSKWTALTFACVCAVQIVCYFTLALHLATALTVIGFLEWCVVLIQKLKME